MLEYVPCFRRRPKHTPEQELAMLYERVERARNMPVIMAEAYLGVRGYVEDERRKSLGYKDVSDSERRLRQARKELKRQRVIA